MLCMMGDNANEMRGDMRILLGIVCGIALAVTCAAQAAVDKAKEKQTAAQADTPAKAYNGTWEFIPGKSRFSATSAG